MRTLITVGVLVILALIFLWPGKGQLKALYVVDETEQVIITRFGEVQSVKTNSGLEFGSDYDLTLGDVLFLAEQS